MSTKTLRKRIALVAVSAMGFGLLSVAPSANATIGVDDAAAIASATVAPVRVGDTQNVTVNLTYGNTADTYTVGTADTANVGAVVRARVLTGPTGGSIGAAVRTSNLVNTFAAVQNTGSTTVATISPTIQVSPNVAGTYTLLVWVDESDTGGSNASFPEVSDLQTTVSFTTAGTPATVNLTTAARSGRAGLATAGSFGFTLRDAAGNLTYLMSSLGETLSGSVSDVSANTTGGALAVENGTVANLGSAGATTKSITVAAATGTGAISVATTAAGIARARIVGSGSLTGVVPAVTADYTTVAFGFATGLSLTTTTGVSSTEAATANPTDPAALSTSSRTGSIWASNASARSLVFGVTNASAATTIQYTIAARTGISLPTGVVAGTYTVTTAAAASDFAGSFTIAATAATAGSGYTVTVAEDATNNLVYTVISSSNS